jgi:hypothetical protein
LNVALNSRNFLLKKYETVYLVYFQGHAGHFVLKRRRRGRKIIGGVVQVPASSTFVGDIVKILCITSLLLK